MTKSFIQNKRVQFEKVFGYLKPRHTKEQWDEYKAFLSESMEQAYKEGIHETAIVMDKDMTKFLESKSKLSVDLLNSVKEQARKEEREIVKDKLTSDGGGIEVLEKYLGFEVSKSEDKFNPKFLNNQDK